MRGTRRHHAAPSSGDTSRSGGTRPSILASPTVDAARLVKELWATEGSRIAVRFAYEWHDDSGNWYRSYGNENWQFTEHGLMERRHASINDLPIAESERLFHWPLGPRPADHSSLSDLGL